MWDYSKIQEPCFVCKVEDELGEERGTQSHPINCGWRVSRENKGYVKGLESIYNLCNTSNDADLKEVIKKIKILAVDSLVGRYDMK